MALLFLAGQSINLITLFGLAVGIGMLVDNSIVVYEAVQRRLEQGADADTAAVDGVRRTVRAIIAASVTNAVVFVPVPRSVTREDPPAPLTTLPSAIPPARRAIAKTTGSARDSWLEAGPLM